MKPFINAEARTSMSI